jgi:uncharacterized small protein (DUF1192 family)
MHTFASADEVEQVLDAMTEHVERLERQPGQKGGRFAQRLVEAEPDEITVLRSEVARLRAENEALRAELAQNRGGSV